MHYLIAGFLALVHAATFAVAADAPARESLSLDADWRFNLGDIPMPEITGHGPGRSYDTEVHRVRASAADEINNSSIRKE